MNDAVAPLFPDVSMNLVPPSKPVIGRVVSNDSCMHGKSASFVRHTVIDVGGTALAGTLHAGQAFGVIPPGTDRDGRPHKVRLYSLACPGWGEDGGGRLISTTPKRLIDEYRAADPKQSPPAHRLFLGVCSNYLCGLQLGDPVHVSGPNGRRFLLPVDRGAHDYLFIATGTGIAPFRGMVRELLEHPDGAVSSRVQLIAGSPYHSDLLYHDLFRRLAARHHNFRYDVAISRECGTASQAGGYVHEVLDRSIDRLGPMLESNRTLLYLCGVAGMEASVFETLARHSLDRGYFTLRHTPDRDDSDAPLRHRAVRTSARCMLEVY